MTPIWGEICSELSAKPRLISTGTWPFRKPFQALGSFYPFFLWPFPRPRLWLTSALRVEWLGSQQCPVIKAIIMISVIGTPRIQSNIERIIVSFMSCNKIIRLSPYEFFTSCPVKRHPASENASRLPQKSVIQIILTSHLNPWPVHLLADALTPLKDAIHCPRLQCFHALGRLLSASDVISLAWVTIDRTF